MVGQVHSIESFGTVDGPGVRLVVFMQGCPMRCKYCHNPDTWSFDGGHAVTDAEIFAQYQKNAPFYKNGGITVTGGEPLCQMAFVTTLFRNAQAEGVHTCLDTSGVTFRPEDDVYLAQLDALLQVTDLVMLDIKQIDAQAHKELCGHGNENILQFAEYLDKIGVQILVRHVIVPGITDAPAEQYALGRFLGGLKHLKALDALPYHTMGEVKYQAMGIEYPLKGVKDLPKEEAVQARKMMLQGIHDARKGLPYRYISSLRPQNK